MYARSLRCAFCGAAFALELTYGCKSCGGTLDVDYDYPRAFKDGLAGADNRVKGVWRYARLLPIRGNITPVTLGEGGTPLTHVDRLAEDIRHGHLFIKNETLNPTLSFKDRPVSVALTAARQFGINRIVVASTGNTGVAASAYAAKAGLICTVYVPMNTPAEKLALMRLYGARIKELPGTFSDAHGMAARDSHEQGTFNLTSTFLNPYALEGDKTLAYELFEQYGGAPDWIIIPVGAGPLLVGCLKGFRELQLAGFISRLPRMVAVQSLGCSPIVRAFEHGHEDVRPWERSQTIASGIDDSLTSHPRDGTRTLRAIRESNGLAVAVTDEQTLECARLLAIREGILAEPAAATTVAAARMIVQASCVKPDQSVVCVITGHGVKDLEHLLTH